MDLITINAIDDYLKWLRGNMRSNNMEDGSLEITVPFLDANNDHFRYYIENTPNGIVLTDIGLSLNELELAGCNLTKSRMQQIHEFARAYGVSIVDEALVIPVNDRSELPYKQHMLIQAMIHINDMFVTIRQKTQNYFKEDVAAFLKKNEIRYISDFSKTGKSGLTQPINFVIPESTNYPERFIQLVNSPNKNNIITTLFSLRDIEETYSSEIKAYIFLNDEQNKVAQTKSLIASIRNYGYVPVPWSKVEGFIDELAG